MLSAVMIRAFEQCSNDARKRVLHYIQRIESSESLADRDEAAEQLQLTLFPPQIALPRTSFSQLLQDALRRSNTSKAELADRLHCSPSAISNLLKRNRKPRRETVRGIASALNVPPRSLWPYDYEA
ncbi:hypothetical protein B7486_04620 [cyanobacterium TDX16]|nr:hypothetical protein B7486_04620 [cyanobacterium TDX16]